MASLTLEFPSIAEPDMIDALARQYGYEAMKRVMTQEGPKMESNPQSAKDFVTEQIKRVVRDQIVAGGAAIAAEKARALYIEQNKNL